jgi:Ankyrin repeats (3 copies)
MAFQPFKNGLFALIVFLAWNNTVFGDELSDAVGNRDLESVKRLLKANPDNATYTDKLNKYGGTHLQMAAFLDQLDIAKLLILNKADVNKRDISGRTALSCAASKGYKDMVELLLANNADVDGDGNNFRPLEEALRMDHEDVAEILLQHGALGSKCTTKPFAGWYSNGDIRFHLVKVVTDDYQEYVTKNKLVMPQDFEIYYENQTGKYAVTFLAFLGGNTSCRYALIYDKNNKRIKVEKYDCHHYQC